MCKKRYVLILLCMFSSTIKTFAGTEIQNGGDSSVAEFKNLASEVMYGLKDEDFVNLASVSKTKFYNASNNSKIECKDNLRINDVPKEAINYPFENPQRIELDCKKWRENSQLSSKYQLVVHEFLFLSLVDDSTYRYSISLVRQFQNGLTVNRALSEDLIESALSCDMRQFTESILEGANVFYTNKNGYSALLSSIESNCFPIVKELVNLGAKVDLTSKVNLSIANLLLRDFKIFGEEEKKQFLESKFALVSFLVKQNTQLVNFQFFSPTDYSNLSIFDLGDLGEVLKECLYQSTIMHLLAYKNDLMQLNKLRALGYRTDIKNHCGETPDMILKRNIYYSSLPN